MLEVPHVIIGAAIATKIVNPVVAIPLAFASHFLLDRIPHWNPHLNTEIQKYGKPTTQTTIIVIADSIIALILGTLIASHALPDTSAALNILAACFASVLPDIVEIPYFFLQIKSKFIQKWIAFQKSIQVDTSIFPGVITQILTIFAALFWIYS